MYLLCTLCIIYFCINSLNPIITYIYVGIFGTITLKIGFDYLVNVRRCIGQNLKTGVRIIKYKQRYNKNNCNLELGKKY